MIRIFKCLLIREIITQVFQRKLSCEIQNQIQFVASPSFQIISKAMPSNQKVDSIGTGELLLNEWIIELFQIELLN